jgi:hypothetical protein
LTRYNEFGGAPRNFLTRNALPVVPDVGVYRINGTGRDTYISMDNGGNFLHYAADKQPLRGTIGFGDRRFNSKPKINPSYETKKISYYCNGTGRDNYIA